MAKTGTFSQFIYGNVTIIAMSSADGKTSALLLNATLLLIIFIASTDFSRGAYSFMIKPTEQQTYIPIPIIDDTTVEQPQEHFLVSLSLQPQSGVTLGTSEASVIIMDNDSE